MKNKKVIITIMIFVIILIGVVLYLVVDTIKENNQKELTNSVNNIGEGANDFITGIDSAKSHLDEFTYNYQTGEVEYKPIINFDSYNKIEEGWTLEEVRNILGKEDNTLKQDEGNTYIIEYGQASLPEGYWIHITFNKITNKVVDKMQIGLQ